MLLLSVDEMFERLAYDRTEDLEKGIERALRTATQVLRSDLRMDFDRVTGVRDVFRIDRTNFVQAPVGSRTSRFFDTQGRAFFSDLPLLHVKLMLGMGLVDPDLTGGVEVFAASLPAHLDDPSFRRDLANFSDGLSHLMFDYEEGVVAIDGLFLDAMYVGVTYDAGLFVNSDDVYEGVPEWLRELAFLRATVLIDADPVLRTENQVRLDKDTTAQQIRAILGSHIRYRPEAVKPFARG